MAISNASLFEQPAETAATDSRLSPLVRHALAPVEDVVSALAQTRRLTSDHYENFSVVSVLLPKHLRQDFCNVYAFCRVADDLADEIGDQEASLHHLAQLRQHTLAAYQGNASSNLFVALSQTVRRHDIPVEPFLDLIDAFEQDQRVTRYETFEQLVNYCRRSANPVGRLVLYMSGYRDAHRQHLSDQTCTALQLINFWQDVRRDLEDRDRIYLPADTMRQFGLSEESLKSQISAGRSDDNFRGAIKFETDRVESMFAEGRKLLPLLDQSVRGQVALFGAGGMAILNAVRRQGYDTIVRRPSLSRLQKGRLVMRGLAATLGRYLMPARAALPCAAGNLRGAADGNRVGEHECQLSR